MEKLEQVLLVGCYLEICAGGLTQMFLVLTPLRRKYRIKHKSVSMLNNTQLSQTFHETEGSVSLVVINNKVGSCHPTVSLLVSRDVKMFLDAQHELIIIL